MALGLTGQFSWQTMQGIPMAQGRQRPLSMKAVPILTGPLSVKGPEPIRSSSSKGRMAAVGQTWPQAMQLCWHPLDPSRKSRRGVHSPSIPASNTAGCITLVGQTRMHSPHLIHRFKNSFSVRLPGGRTRSGRHPTPKGSPRRARGKRIAPVAPEVITALLLKSGPGISPVVEGRVP